MTGSTPHRDGNHKWAISAGNNMEHDLEAPSLQVCKYSFLVSVELDHGLAPTNSVALF